MAESRAKRGEMPHIGAQCTLQQQYLEPCLGPRLRKGKALAEGRDLDIIDIWAVRICTPQPALGGAVALNMDVGQGRRWREQFSGPGLGATHLG
jgi:hypothetical protein